MWSELDSDIAIHMHLIDYIGSFPTRVQLGEIEDAFQHLLADLVIIVVSLGVDSLNILVDSKLALVVDCVKVEGKRLIGDHVAVEGNGTRREACSFRDVGTHCIESVSHGHIHH